MNGIAVKTTTLQEKALIESEKAKPSSNPKYWAKSSCTKCNGTGQLGFISRKIDGGTMRNGQICSCASKNFTRWRDAWIAEFIQKHTTSSAIPESPTSVDKTP